MVWASLLAPVVMVVVSVNRERGSLGRGCEGELRAGGSDIGVGRTKTARYGSNIKGGRGVDGCWRGVSSGATQLRVEARGAVTKGGRLVRGPRLASARAVVQTLLQGLGLGLLSLLAAAVDDLDVVVEDGRDDRHEIGLDDPGSDVL